MVGKDFAESAILKDSESRRIGLSLWKHMSTEVED